MTHEAESRPRLTALWRLNRHRFESAGWSLGTYLALPTLAVRTALFPTDPPAWGVEAPPLPLLPAQVAVQNRLDTARTATPVRRPAGTIHLSNLHPKVRLPDKTRRVATNRIVQRPLVLRDGFWIEPLTHHAHGARRHYAPRPGQEA